MDEHKNEGDAKISTVTSETTELSRSSSLNSIGQYITDQDDNAKSSRLLKRRLFAANDVDVSDNKQSSPSSVNKRRRSITNPIRPDVPDQSGSSPSQTSSASVTSVTKTPENQDGAKSRLAPRSERQQMAMLMQMERVSRGNSPVTVTSSCTSLSGQQQPTSSLLPSSFCSGGIKRAQFDKKANKRNDKGETLIHLAAIRGDIKCVKHLIRSGVNVNIKDYAGWTPLHESCNHGWLEVTNILLRAGAKVNVQGYDNDTPLHDAVTNGHKKLVELLLRYGANPSQQNTKGEAPEHIECSQVIKDLLANPPLSSGGGVSQGHPVIAGCTLSSGASSLDEDDFYDPKEEAKHTESKRSLTPPVQRIQPPLKLKFKKTIHEDCDVTTTTVTTITSPSMSEHAPSSAPSDPIKPLIVKNEIIAELSAAPGSGAGKYKERGTKSMHVDQKFMQKLSTSDKTKSTSDKSGIKYTPYQMQHRDFKQVDKLKINVLPPPERKVDKSVLRVETSDSKIRFIDRMNKSPAQEKIAVPSVVDKSNAKVSFDRLSKTNPSSVDKHSLQTSHSHQHPHQHHHHHHHHSSSSLSSKSDKITDRQYYRPGEKSTSYEPMKTADNNRQSTRLPVKIEKQYDRPKPNFDAAFSGKNVYKPPVEKQFERIAKPQEKSPDWSSLTTPVTQRSTEKYDARSTSKLSASSIEKLFRPVDKIPGEFAKEKDSPPATTFTKLTSDKYSSKTTDKEEARKAVEKFYVKSTKPFDFQQAKSFETQKTTEKLPSKNSFSKIIEHNSDSDVKPPIDKNINVDSKQNIVKINPEEISRSSKVADIKPFEDNSNRSTFKSVDKVVTPEMSDKDLQRNAGQANTDMTSGHLNNIVIKEEPKIVEDHPFEADINQSKALSDDNEANLKVKVENRSISPKVPPLKIFVSSANASEIPRTTASLPPNQTNSTTVNICKRPTTSQLVQSIGRVRDELASVQTISPSTGTLDSPQSVASPPHCDSVDDAATLQKIAIDAESDVNSKDSFSNLALEQADSPASSIATSKPTRSRRLRNDKTKVASTNQSEDNTDQSERRVTRAALRSQQLQQQSDGKDSDADTEKPSITLDIPPASAVITSTNQNAPFQSAYEHVHPRKRKLRQKPQQETTGCPSPAPSVTEPLPPENKTVTNPYTRYYRLKNKSIKERFANAKHIVPKTPPQYERYSMVKRDYTLQKVNDPLPIMTEASACLPPPFRKLYTTQEKQRYILSRKHQVEMERLKLCCEEQTLRVYGIATRAQSSNPRSTPISMCGIVLMEKAEHALPMDDSPMPLYRDTAAMMLMLNHNGTESLEQHNATLSNVDNSTSSMHCNAASNRGRNGYNGRHLIGWLRDINDKFEKLKDNQLSRQQNEAEALLSMQKLEWSWVLKSYLNDKASPDKEMYSDEKYVPMIGILEDFNLLPIPDE